MNGPHSNGVDQTPTWPNKESRDRFMSEMIERIHSSGYETFTTEQKMDIKRLFKEAASEWLEDKFAIFGRWALISVLAAVFIGLIFFAMTMQGWHLSKSVAESSETIK